MGERGTMKVDEYQMIKEEVPICWLAEEEMYDEE
jgi:hypothetical protein